jgi:16S rRNA (adenine1518-N6/adenine1519-N6)-dimethyltransferase
MDNNKSNSIVPNLKLGQHFIKDQQYLNKITSLLDKESLIIEVGPGMGQFTKVLAKKSKKVIAIEIDNRFRKYLLPISKKNKNIEVVFADALSKTFDSIILKNKKKFHSTVVVSNLPYHITEPFITKLAILNLPAILIVGKKFGYQSQIVNPKEEYFSELSFICKSFFDIEKITNIPKTAFWPIPKKDSVIIKLVPKKIKTDSEYIGQKIILSQKHGGLIKNVLMNAIIQIKSTQNSKITKNQARNITKRLKIDNSILNKAFSQLNNNEVKKVAISIDKANLHF